MFPFSSTDPSMYPRIAKEQSGGGNKQTDPCFLFTKRPHRGPPFVFLIPAKQFPEMKQCFVLSY